MFTYVNEISLQVIVRELPRGTSSSKSKKAVCTVSNLHDITKFTPHIMVFLSLNITQHVRMCFSQYTCVCFTMSVYQVTLDMLTGFHFHGNIHSDMMMFMLKAGIQRRKERHNILSALRTAWRQSWNLQEPTGTYRNLPVTCTPSISLEFTFIINRRTIYITACCLIDKWLAIYKCFIFFDLHMHQVTSFKCWSPILPSATQTLGDILVYVLPQFLPNLPKMCKKRAFLLRCLTHRMYRASFWSQ